MDYKPYSMYLRYLFIFTAKVDDKMQHRKVKSIAILVHSDETQFYICSTNEKVCNLHDYATNNKYTC